MLITINTPVSLSIEELTDFPKVKTLADFDFDYQPSIVYLYFSIQLHYISSETHGMPHPLFVKLVVSKN